VHTLKGTSSFLGFQPDDRIDPYREDLLNKLRKGDCLADSHIIDVLIEVHTAASALLQRIESRNVQPIELSGILEKLRAAMQQQPVTAQGKMSFR